MLQDLMELEEQGWQALSTGGDAGRVFYSSVLRNDATMLFPGGMLIEGKESILESLAAQPWKSFRIDRPQVVPLSKDVGVLIYRVVAQREGSEPYEALISSTYVHNGERWQLVVHQQTPV